MNKIVIFAAALTLASLLTGCTTDKEKVINRVNQIYTNVKVIVTDPDIKALISDDSWQALVDAETVYLDAVKILETVELSSTDGKSALSRIVECADTILLIVNMIDVPDEYDSIITTVRLSVELLRVNVLT